MITASINLTLVALIALPIGAAILVVTILFFMKTRKSLQETLEANRRNSFLTSYPEQKKEKRSGLFSELEEQFSRMKNKVGTIREAEPLVVRKKPVADENLVQNLKTTIAQQQKLLNSYLQQVEEMENGGKEELKQQNQELEREIAKLHQVIDQKDAEIEEVMLQSSASQKMAAKIEEVYQEFDQLQIKMSNLEKQANRTNALAIELEDTKHSYEQVHKELLRKHEKLETIMEENQRMRQEMNVLEDKLSESNLQRQQLQKKVVFLQELNAEMQSISDANKKLQTELRRIGELESMLNMMAEERDSLLRKKDS